MDKINALEIAEKYKIAIKDKFDCKRVILFGSYAKGNINDDSDITVFFDDYKNVLDMQLDLRRQIDSRIEPHPFRKKDFNLSNPLVNEIITYGKKKINTLLKFFNIVILITQTFKLFIPSRFPIAIGNRDKHFKLKYYARH
ncbi:MAG: nucleotidyltransferase domain-containing protein [Paludibacter sp.]|nr:nucleotidyltransferase domain-containing protein [Paludibacter sp.]